MQLNIPHNFSQAIALQRVKMAILQAKPQIADKATIEEERWEENTLHFAVTAEGKHFSGTFTVKDKEFDLDVKLPLMMRLFEGKIKKAIEEQAGQMLGK